jgi:outer membrane protein assembly factor BamB
LASVSGMVSTKGRLFYIVDNGQTSDIRLPARWELVARDAFSGVVLWRRKIDKWSDHLHGFRNGPPDLTYRLVAVKDRVHVCLNEDQPVMTLDAATGKTLHTYQGTENARQLICTDKTLVMLTGTSQVAIRLRKVKKGEAKRLLTVADAETGAIRWKKEIEEDALIPLAVSDGYILYQTLKELVCLSIDDGNEKWRTSNLFISETESSSEAKGTRNKKSKKKKSHGGVNWHWLTPTLVAQKGIVYVGGPELMVAVSLKDGEILWKSNVSSGFSSPADIFLINDQVWPGVTRSRGAADFEAGLNAQTGNVEKKLNNEKAWSFKTLAHHRCYRPKATSKFILSSRSGVEFINLKTGEIDLNHWIRGTCQYGVLPCNGLLYAPPHSCACNIKTMLRGLIAFASTDQQPLALQANEPALVKGPAYGEITERQPIGRAGEDWPVFRHDGERSGNASTQVPSKIKPIWRTKIGGKISSPVVSKGRVFVSEVDAHTVHALNSSDGASVWSFTAGARIDSPPTAYKNRILFGSADGWVYCVRETDGELIWRYRGAPKERTIIVRGQPESAWPIHGSVLVQNDSIIISAGRNSYVDGGIYITRLDPRTGKKLDETVINSLDSKTGKQPDGGEDLPGVLNDILTVSGQSVYMRHLKLDLKTGDDLQTGAPHLFAPVGWVDGNWWHRSYWMYGSDSVNMPPRNISGWAIWSRMGNMVPSGRIMSVGKNHVFGYGRNKYPYGFDGQFKGGEKNHLFAAQKEASEVLKLKPTNIQSGLSSVHEYLWTTEIPIYAKAMTLTDQAIFVAGPPETEQAKNSGIDLEDPEKVEASYLGKEGVSIYVVSAKDGKQIANYKLNTMPVFDGMIAAQRRLFISMEDGSIVCHGE